MKIRKVAVAAALAAGFAGSAVAVPVELITNGGFETGTFAGWTVTDEFGGSGSWFVPGAPTTPLSGFATAGPAAGAFYAVTDQGGPGAHGLTQAFTVPLGATSVIVTFDMFMNDQSGGGPVVNPAGLTFTAGANQHARVDILTAVAGGLSTAPLDIVSVLVAPTVDAGPNPHAYTAYLFDITGLVAPGGTYQIRFGEVDNLLFFHQGVDNVSILAQVPEPASLALLGLGLLGLGALRRRI